MDQIRDWTPHGDFPGPHSCSTRLLKAGFESMAIMFILLPLKTPSPEKKLIFYRHIAHVTPKQLKSCVFKR